MNINDYKQEIKDCVKQRMNHCKFSLLEHPEWEPRDNHPIPFAYGDFSNASYQCMVEIRDAEDLRFLNSRHFDQMLKACRKSDTENLFTMILEKMMVTSKAPGDYYLVAPKVDWAVAIRNRDI